MRIGIIGAGNIGGTLARGLAKLGHRVSIANSRGSESLTALAAEIGATPVSVVGAAKAGEIVIISIPVKAVPKGTTERIALSVVGDSLDAKAAVLRLVDELGFDPLDGGDLDNSWRQQPGTPAYCRDLEAAALRRALTEADRSRIAEYRAEQEARIRRHIAAQTTKE